MKFRILPLAGVLLFASTFSVQSHAWFFFKDYNKRGSVSITETVAKSGGDFDNRGGDFDILLNAVTIAGLADALANPDASLTVFAPTDSAFIKLANDLGYEGHDEAGAFNAIVETLTALGGGDPVPILTDILLYHVSPDEKKAWQIFFSRGLDTLLAGGTILPYYGVLVDNDPEFSNAQVSFWARGTSASNGVIYKVGRVLIPVDLPAPGQDDLPTITEVVALSGGEFDNDPNDFDLLLTAVLAAGLEGALADKSTPLTVFAPNDAAFIKLANDLGYVGHDEAEAFSVIVTALTELGGGELLPILTNVLLYHVAPEPLTLKQVVESDAVTTLLDGATIAPKGTVLKDNAPALADPRVVTSASNILTSNGRVHLINRVLIPVAIP